jgi:hypothetical protein
MLDENPAPRELLCCYLLSLLKTHSRTLARIISISARSDTLFLYCRSIVRLQASAFWLETQVGALAQIFFFLVLCLKLVPNVGTATGQN